MEQGGPHSARNNVAASVRPGHQLPLQRLSDPINESTKRQIAEQFFGINTDGDGLSSLGSFFDRYNNELNRLRVGIKPPVLGLDTKTHEDVLHIRRLVSESRNKPRSVLRDRLRPRLPTDDDISLDRMIDMTIRLWLMINVRDERLSMSLWRPQQSACWDESDTLEQFLDHQFPKSATNIDLKQSRLEMRFTVAYMVQTCRLQIIWTDDLVNHLRLDRKPGAKVLSIFPHKPFLVAHLQNTRNPVLPKQLVRETITSLNMLFPQSDPATRELLQKYNQNFDSVPPFEGPRRLSLREYSYWRDHLEDLHEVFQAEPDSWFQLFFDRRNPQQWWTFWIALVVFVLSVASLGTSVAQVVIAQKALDLQRSSMRE